MGKLEFIIIPILKFCCDPTYLHTGPYQKEMMKYGECLL